MSLFEYKAIDDKGKEVVGTIDAINRDVAITAIQKRGLVIASLTAAEERGLLNRNIDFLTRVSTREVVILSRQISTLFEAQVSALKVFALLGGEAKNPLLRDALAEVGNDLQGGSSISDALSKHPKIFSNFYVNMVRVGEESGKLEEVFGHLADHLDRTYEVASKARNALIYPAFVILTFMAVMVLMLTTVIPKLSGILEDSIEEIPVYTKAVLGISDFFVNYGLFLLIVLVIGIFALIRYWRTESGSKYLAQLKLSIPYIGTLYRKLYLSRIADNMHTMLLAGIPMVRTIESTASVVGNVIYEDILIKAGDAIRGGSSVSDALSGHEEIPGILVQMVRVGEETGELGNILKTLANFYRREVNNEVDTLVDLIEPAMIVMLGVGVGVLLASVLIPIYNISSGF